MMEMHGMVKRNVEILEEENKELNLLLQQHMAVEDVGNKHDASDHK
jgi:MADS-box transcription factor